MVRSVLVQTASVLILIVSLVIGNLGLTTEWYNYEYDRSQSTTDSQDDDPKGLLPRIRLLRVA